MYLLNANWRDRAKLKNYGSLENSALFISDEHWQPSRNPTFKAAIEMEEFFKKFFLEKTQETLLTVQHYRH